MKTTHTLLRAALASAATVAFALNHSASASAPRATAQDVRAIERPGRGTAVEDLEAPGFTRRGEQLAPSSFGPGVIENMDIVLQRESARPAGAEHNPKARNGAHGAWLVPSRNAATATPHSGERYAMNQWGDTHMGLGFAERVDVDGAWFAGQGGAGSWAHGVQAIGYRAGVEVAHTAWLEEIGETPVYLAMNFVDVERIEIVARPASDGAGWYAFDDLAFRSRATRVPQVIDFEDQTFGARLTGSAYRGLSWESGTGDFHQAADSIHRPKTPPGSAAEQTGLAEDTQPYPSTVFGTPPSLGTNFIGPKQNDAGAGYIPPDTCGAVGINHFVAVVNANLSIYLKSTGQRVLNSSLNSFFGSSVGADPRVTFDPSSQRFIILTSDFSTRIFIAISLTSDPTGAWYKNSIVVSQGNDANSWPDYPTLGVDQNGIYTSSYMVGGVFGMSIFAIDKAPLLAPVPSLGTVTAWRELPWEGAIQPCVTYGTPAGEYLVSRRTATRLRLRRVNAPLTAPTLTEVGSVTVPSHGSPPDVPALGSTTALDALDYRPYNAVFRNGSVWTAHGITFNGRAACRWYELNPTTLAPTQVGTIADSVLSFSFPTIAVNANGDVVVGFSGAEPNQYGSSYFTGRNANDPLSVTATPVLLKLGLGPYNNVDGGGTNRWGDYSLTSVDPVDDFSIWTIQEYARGANSWGTWIGKLIPGCPGSPDCNANGVIDTCDIASGFSSDNNVNGLPDECEGFSGSAYCFGDGSLATQCPCAVPDFVPVPSGASDAGCGNSVNLSGAKLTIAGSTSPDTLTFTVDIGSGYGGYAFLVKGDASDASGIATGDGVRCADGALIRFGAHNAGTNGSLLGQWTYPNPVQTLPVSQATLQPSAATAYYQLFYRNAVAGFCSSGTTNFSNGFRIDWP